MSPESVPLTPEDLSMLYADQPRQRTTMSMLMLLDRAPEPERLRGAVWRAIEAVPRMRQRVVRSPLDLSLPRWEEDPTFDLDFHVRRYSEAPVPEGQDELRALFHTTGPIYERPFDESRPLWELVEIDRPRRADRRGPGGRGPAAPAREGAGWLARGGPGAAAAGRPREPRAGGSGPRGHPHRRLLAGRA
jgi:hypothetical protein